MDMTTIYAVLVVSTLLYIAFLIYNRTIGRWLDQDNRTEDRSGVSRKKVSVRYPLEDLVTEALNNRNFVQDIKSVCATDLDHPTSYLSAFEVIDKRIRKIRTSEFEKFVEFTKAKNQKTELTEVSIENIVNCHVYFERLVEFRKRNCDEEHKFQLTGLKNISEILVDQIDLVASDLKEYLAD